MALYAFDGTWNREKTDDHLDKNTNVVRFKNAYDKNGGKTFYRAGVGTRFDFLHIGTFLGGAFGLGELPRLNESYNALCELWDAGDRIIDIVGFSRGAATALDFCHIIQKRKIRKPHSDQVVEEKPQIRFLGLWDVVAAFGLANLGFVDFNFGHHLSLPKSDLQFAFHALALDERRPSFLPTRLRGAYEVWFRGVHSEVGGGKEGKRGLSDISLKWMMCKARAAGLPIVPEDIEALHPDASLAPDIPGGLKLDLRLVSDVDRRHHTVEHTDGCRDLPESCLVEGILDELSAAEVGHTGIETLPQEFDERFKILTAVTEREAMKLEFPWKDIREAMLGLIESRMPLVRNDQDVIAAIKSIVRLLPAVERHAKAHQFHALNEFFINEALFELMPLFPFTDRA